VIAALGDDALQAEFAGVGEHRGAVAGHVLHQADLGADVLQQLRPG
jgi:hypothetical protein